MTRRSICPPLRTNRPIAKRPIAHAPRTISVVSIIRQDFICRAHAFLRGTFKQALEINRAVFTCKMTVAGPFSLRAGDCRVLADLPEGIGAEKVRVLPRCIECCMPIPFATDAWKYRLEL